MIFQCRLLSVLVLTILLTFPISSFADGVEPNSPRGNQVQKIQVGNSNTRVFVHYNADKEMINAKTWSSVSGKTSYLHVSVENPSIIEGSLGQRSVGTVPAVFERKYAKKAVLKGVFTVGKQVAKRAVSLSPWVMGAWLAYDIYKEFAESDGFTKGEDGDFYKPFDSGGNSVYAAIKVQSSYVGGIDTRGYKSVDTYCSKSDAMCVEFLGYTTDPNSFAREFCFSLFKSRYSDVKFEKVSWQGMHGCEWNRTSLTRPGIALVKVFESNSPFTLQDFERLANDAADQAIEKYINASNVEPESTTATVPNGTVAYSNPFTDPADNKPKQTRWKFTQKPDGTTEVEELTLERPDLEPNSAAAPTINNNTNIDNSTTNNNENESSEEQKQDLCEKHPDSLMCDKQPEPMPDPDLSIPEKVVNLQFTPDNRFDEIGQCPAPVQFDIDILGSSNTYAFTFDRVCEVASRLHYLLIAMAWVVAAFFCIRVVSRD